MRAGVVGCGIGGMAAALALARRGWSVTVLEAFERPGPVGSGLLLQPSGLGALGALGLADAALACGARVDRLDGKDPQGRQVLLMDYARWRRDAFGLGIHRAVLFDLLHQALPAAGIEVVTSAQVTAVEDFARPVVGDAAGRSFGPFDLLVAADGQASTLRPLLNPRARAPLYPWGAVWGNCADPEGRFDGVLGQRYRRAEIMLGVLPIGRGPDAAAGRQVSLFWSLPTADMDAFFQGDLGAWKAEAAACWPAVEPLLAQIGSLSQLAPARYRDVSSGRWSRGACVLIGDAAHGTSPQLGQGANLALVDAVELAARVERAARPVAVSLAAYQRRRRAHTAWYQIASRWLTPMFQSHGRGWAMLRDLALVPAARLPVVGRMTAATLAGMARFPWAGRFSFERTRGVN